MVDVSVQFIFNTRVSLSAIGAATSSLVGLPTPLVLGMVTMSVGARSRWLVMSARV